MAKRRKLTTPSPEDLEQIETEFRRETSPAARPAGMAPIAQVAAETAQAVDVLGPDTRAKLAEADAYRDAREQGLVISEIPLDQINADEMFRDRTVLIQAELDELKDSIVKNGLRLPIEVFEREDAKEGEARYGLISGYRRLLVVREAYEFSELDKYSRIKAIIRPAKTSAERFAAVVEENEVRSSLSHFERGRFAALTASDGVFGSVEEAVEQLFPFASKAKRSKVRSFALIFDEMGDLLKFPETLTEKQGLRLAGALRAGAENELRDSLAHGRAESGADEWLLMQDVIETSEDQVRDPARGGRPTKAPQKSKPFKTSSGVQVGWESAPGGGYVIRLKGRGLDSEVMDSLMAELRHLLGRPNG